MTIPIINLLAPPPHIDMFDADETVQQYMNRTGLTLTFLAQVRVADHIINFEPEDCRQAILGWFQRQDNNGTLERSFSAYKRSRGDHLVVWRNKSGSYDLYLGRQDAMR